MSEAANRTSTGPTDGSALRIGRTHPSDPNARWCVQQYYKELDARLETGFDPTASIPADDTELVPPKGAFVLATLDGEPVACGALKTIGSGLGSVKRMWVARNARGLGLGRSILTALELEARELGFTRLRLETNRALQEAIALYRSSGYVEVDAFNDDPYAHHWFEKDLKALEPSSTSPAVESCNG